MNQKFRNRFLLAAFIALVFITCNQADKKDDATKPADSTGAAKPAADKPATVPDAIAAAPNLYKVLADTMGIRILEVTYNPGDSSALHSHPDYAIYCLAGGTAAFYTKDGTKMDADMKSGTIMIHPAELHSVKNTGKSVIKVILFEVNRPMGNVAMDAALDATKVAGGLYTKIADTLGIRVVQINYKPGQASAMHAHPDVALYVTDAGKAEFTSKDGKKMVMDMKAGMTMIGPADTHSVKNIGTTTMKAILVEVSRPVK